METKHFFRDGSIEVGTGGPGYRWVTAYAEAISQTAKSMPLTRRHWQAIGKRDGFKCRFHESQQEALASRG